MTAFARWCDLFVVYTRNTIISVHTRLSADDGCGAVWNFTTVPIYFLIFFVSARLFFNLKKEKTTFAKKKS